MRFILASASPRRKELFGLTGWEADILPTHVPEQLNETEAPLDYVTRLAESKARKAVSFLKTNERAAVIAADTIVVSKGRILEKPVDSQEAEFMLKTLRGRTHQVHTALSIIDVPGGTGSDCVCTTDVPMRSYSRDEILDYISSGSPMDKAGGYGIQDTYFSPVLLSRMEGCYANVMGLPLCHLLVLLRGFGMQPEADVPGACQDYNSYCCPVHEAILGGEPCAEPR